MKAVATIKQKAIEDGSNEMKCDKRPSVAINSIY